MDGIKEFVLPVVAKAFGKDVSEISLDTNLIDDLGADSANFFPIMNALEDEYDLDIQYQKFRQQCPTVKDIISYVEREA